MSNSQFAYGDDEAQGCKCPAAAAGYAPSSGDGSQRIASEFDRLIRSKMEYAGDIGVVGETTAETAWRETIRQFHEAGKVEQVRLGVKIAEELGWEVDE